MHSIFNNYSNQATCGFELDSESSVLSLDCLNISKWLTILRKDFLILKDDPNRNDQIFTIFSSLFYLELYKNKNNQDVRNFLVDLNKYNDLIVQKFLTTAFKINFIKDVKPTVVKMYAQHKGINKLEVYEADKNNYKLIRMVDGPLGEWSLTSGKKYKIILNYDSPNKSLEPWNEGELDFFLVIDMH